ncbi:MAG: hypothetical protein AAGJ68_10620 [Pseudomonadota bacterium]
MMWCPNGFYSWSEVVGYFEEVAETVLPSVRSAAEEHRQEVDLERFLNEKKYVWKARLGGPDFVDERMSCTITTCYLLSNFLQDYPPVLASLDGQIVKVLPVFFEHRDQLHLSPYGWPLRSQTEFRQLFELADQGVFGATDLWDRFAFINPRTGEFCVKNGSEGFLANYVGETEDEARNLIATAKRLKGFVVCWQKVPDKTEIRNFLSYLEVDDSFVSALNHSYGPAMEPQHEQLQTKNRPVGRPSKKPEVRAAYWQCFPQGHERAGKVWKEVHHEVEKVLGTPIAISTLKRAVRDSR